jgi:hypothetical protein
MMDRLSHDESPIDRRDVGLRLPGEIWSAASASRTAWPPARLERRRQREGHQGERLERPLDVPIVFNRLPIWSGKSLPKRNDKT